MDAGRDKIEPVAKLLSAPMQGVFDRSEVILKIILGMAESRVYFKLMLCNILSVEFRNTKRRQTMVIKKTAKKDFHNANRLNGNGADFTASYGLFDGSEQVGFATKGGGGWIAFKRDERGILRPFTRSCRTLKDLRAMVAESRPR